MPITIPEFVQFQGVLYPLRGLWNSPPSEGDRFVNCEIDWGTPGLSGVSCVQFQLSGNSPVAFSQIAAISVDNSRCGSDVDFVFPDSGFILTVPAFNQGVYPVFTNALMFYVNSPLAAAGDVTIAQILNSVPPPVAIQPSAEQQNAGVSGVQPTNGSTPVIPGTVNGTLNGFDINYVAENTTGSPELAFLTLVDGTGRQLWFGSLYVPGPTGNTINGSFDQTNLRLRFQGGVNFVVSSSAIANGAIGINLYYSMP